MMQAIQIGMDMIIMRYEVHEGKVHDLQLRSLPVGVYLKLYTPQPPTSQLPTPNS